jgi:hypothetical protein
MAARLLLCAVFFVMRAALFAQNAPASAPDPAAPDWTLLHYP